jgi:cytoskeletal protein CcmA (bactofilin family)
VFRRDLSTQKPDKFDTVIGKDAEIKGTISCSSGLRVDGKLEGQVIGTGDVVIAEGAVVTANVEARNVLVAGELRGNLHASGRLEISQKGSLIGDICVGSLIIAEGGKLEGKSEMKVDKAKQPKNSDT